MDTITFKNYRLEIVQDEYPDNPRNWDNMSTMAFYHRHYDIGDKKTMTLDECKQFINQKNVISFPVYMYDHSGIGFSLSNDRYPFNCPWDSGQVGWIYITKEKVKEEYSIKKITKHTIDKMYKIFQKEIETYDDYCQGNVWGYTLYQDDEMIDSCWGFYGNDIKTNGMSDHLPDDLRQYIEKNF